MGSHGDVEATQKIILYHLMILLTFVLFSYIYIGEYVVLCLVIKIFNINKFHQNKNTINISVVQSPLVSFQKRKKAATLLANDCTCS